MSDPSMPKPNNTLTSPTSMLPPTALPQRLLTSSSSASPQNLQTGSATGNPRNKCALKPGYSLMGWIRLCDTEQDLAGTRGRIIPVSSEELSKHNSKEDAWMAIRGRVYNVTRYIDYHPGGAEELMRGVGRDATKLFDEVHSWVNYQQLLAKCYIGPLRNTMKIDTIVESSDVGLSKPQTRSENELVPRYDWTQKRGDITIYIYTRRHCNPGLVLLRKTENELEFRIEIEHVRHKLEFEFQHDVDWPPKAVSIGSESGKIEVTFRKITAELWTSYGTHQSQKMSPNIGLEEEEMYVYRVMSLLDFNHDSFELSITSVENVVMLLPIGYHITMSALVNGDIVERSYTPVFSKFLHSKDITGSTYETHLNFLIKSYPETGMLSKHLHELQNDAIIQVSSPRGNLNLESLLKHRRVALLAAGSGITPFLNLIEHLLKRTTNRLENLLLMYFNKTVADIWCQKALKQLQLADERFHVINILSQADEETQNRKGRISLELLEPLKDENAQEHATFVAICGPSAFNQQAEKLLKILKFSAKNIHTFQG